MGIAAVPNKRGFSLLECVIALSIAAVLAGGAVLAHQAIRPQLDLGQGARQVMMDLKVARMRAVTGHATYRVLFGDGDATYQPQRRNGNAYVDDGAPIALPRGIAIVDCNTHDHSISFVPRGNAGSFGTITLRNPQGDTRRVSVNIAGQIRVY